MALIEFANLEEAVSALIVSNFNSVKFVAVHSQQITSI